MWWKQKTTWTGISLIVAALAGYFTGEIDVPALVAGVLNGLGFIFLRQGVAKVAVILLCVTVAVGCASSGVTPSATGTTGVGQYGALSGLQAGSTLVSMGGSVTVQVHPNPGSTMPKSIMDSIEKLSADVEKIASDPTIPMDAKERLISQQADLIAKLSAPWGGVVVTVTNSTGGDASATGSTGTGSGQGVGSAFSEPEKPEGPKATATPETPAMEETPAAMPAETPAAAEGGGQ